MNANITEPSLPVASKVYDPSKWNRDQHVRGYLVLTALRGPDITCALGIALKSIITRRLRAIVFRRDECNGDYTDQPLKAHHLRDLEHCVREILIQSPGTAPKLSHFVTHLGDALLVTAAHPIWAGYADEARGLLRIMTRELSRHEYFNRYNDGR